MYTSLYDNNNNNEEEVVVESEKMSEENPVGDSKA